MVALLVSALTLTPTAWPQSATSRPADYSAQAPASSSGAANTKPAEKPDAHKAKRAYELGLRAEQAGDWSAAFEAYSDAANYAPRDVEILRHKEAARFRLVSQHTDSAERYAVAGKFAEATAELRAALQLDPGYSVAQERLAQFSKLSGSGDQTNAAALAGPVHLQPQPGTRTFDLRGDTRAAYTEVARQFGLTVAFDGDLPSHNVKLRVADVDFATIMILLGDETKTFYRPVNAHLFFVTANTTEKRREYAPVVERSIELPETISTEQMTELQRIVREIAGITHIQLNPGSHTLTVRDSESKVKLAAELMREVQQPRGEVMLEIEILEVDRATALTLGVTPPTKAQLVTVDQADLAALQKASDIGALLAIVQRILGRTGALAGVSSSQLASLIGSGQLAAGALLPPIIAIGGGRSTVLVSLQQAAINFSQEFNLLRGGRRMLLRAQDGQAASFFIGDRFPVALALLSPSLAAPLSIPAVSGTTLPRTDFPVGKAPVALLSEDFNGDRFSDLAVVNRGDNTVSILLNNGNGSFATAAGSPISLGASKEPVAITAGVYDETDGHIDLAVANKSTGDVTILKGDGKGGFQITAGSPITVGKSPTAIVTGAFNTKNDGHLDLAIANSQDNTITILLGDGKGNFTPAASSPLKLAPGEQNPVAILTTDFNLDGLKDLAIVNQATNNVAIFLGNGDGTFTEAPGSPITVGSSPVAVSTGDFDGDGRPDLAVVNQGANSVTVLLGKGGGTFSVVPNSFLTTGSSPAAIITGDFNFDGRPDLLVANSGSDTVSAFLGLGGGVFSQGITLQTGTTPRALVTASFTRNGRADLAVADQGANQVTVILNLLSFTPGGNNIGQQPFPGAEYLDLGLKVKATPRLHGNSEVSLQLLFEIRNLAGSALNGIPIIGNRTIEQSVRLRENETTIISGMLERDEMRSISGLPGLAPAPIGGLLAGRLQSRPRDTELIIMITPRQLRLMPTAGRALYAGRGDEPVPHGGSEGQPVTPQPGGLPPTPGAPQPVPGVQPPTQLPPGMQPPAQVPPGTQPPPPGTQQQPQPRPAPQPPPQPPPQ